MAKSHRLPFENDLSGEFRRMTKRQNNRALRSGAREFCRLVLSGDDPDEVESFPRHRGRNRGWGVTKHYAPAAEKSHRK